MIMLKVAMANLKSAICLCLVEAHNGLTVRSKLPCWSGPQESDAHLRGVPLKSIVTCGSSWLIIKEGIGDGLLSWKRVTRSIMICGGSHLSNASHDFAENDGQQLHPSSAGSAVGNAFFQSCVEFAGVMVTATKTD